MLCKKMEVTLVSFFYGCKIKEDENEGASRIKTARKFSSFDQSSYRNKETMRKSTKWTYWNRPPVAPTCRSRKNEGKGENEWKGKGMYSRKNSRRYGAN